MVVLCTRIKQYFASTASEPEARVFVHLMRHGEAYHNLGHTDIEINYESYDISDPLLTGQGIKQVKCARKKMAKCCPVPNLVLTSPLTRTIETALHVFPPTNHGSTTLQPQIVAYDELRESGAYLCNVRKGVIWLSNKYNLKGVDFYTLPLTIPPMKSEIRTRQRAEIVQKEILRIVRIIRKGGGIWRGVYIHGPVKQSFGWSLRRKTGKDIHIVIISHGSFMKYLLPCKLSF